MHDKLNQFTRNNVWIMVPRTKEMNIIGTNWFIEIGWMNSE